MDVDMRCVTESSSQQANTCLFEANLTRVPVAGPGGVFGGGEGGPSTGSPLSGGLEEVLNMRCSTRKAQAGGRGTRRPKVANSHLVTLEF